MVTGGLDRRPHVVRLLPDIAERHRDEEQVVGARDPLPEHKPNSGASVSDANAGSGSGCTNATRMFTTKARSSAPASPT